MIIIQRIAVLLTCYNRRDKTLNCLNALFHAFLPEVYYIKVFLVDDGSTDGTSEAVRKMFPDVKVIQGNGNLYWNRGMHLAWTTAAKTNKYDFYLWLNDDTILFHSSLLDLVETANKTSCKAIIVGSTVSKNTGKLTYGGMLLSNSNLLKPNENIQNCDYFNGNIVLIPKSVYNVIGHNDPFFHHSLGDLDYGLRANKKNIKSFICSNVQG